VDVLPFPLQASNSSPFPWHNDCNKMTVREYNAYVENHNARNGTSTAVNGIAASPDTGKKKPVLSIDVNDRITTAGTDSVRLKSPRSSPRDSPRSGKKKKRASRGERNASSGNTETAGEAATGAAGTEEANVGTNTIESGRASEDPSGAILQREASATRQHVSRSNSLVRNSASVDSLHNGRSTPVAAPQSQSPALHLESLVLESNSKSGAPSPVLLNAHNVEPGCVEGNGFGSDVRSTLLGTPPRGERTEGSGRGSSRSSGKKASPVTSATAVASETTDESLKPGEGGSGGRSKPAPLEIAIAASGGSQIPSGSKSSGRSRDKEKRSRSVASPREDHVTSAGSLSSQAVAEANHLLAESTNSAKSSSSHHRISRSNPKPEEQSVESTALQAGLGGTRTQPTLNHGLAKQRGGNSSAVPATAAATTSRSANGRKRVEQPPGDTCVLM
jgi:hypothetical protein